MPFVTGGVRMFFFIWNIFEDDIRDVHGMYRIIWAANESHVGSHVLDLAQDWHLEVDVLSHLQGCQYGLIVKVVVLVHRED